jgi:hypothetical protein
MLLGNSDRLPCEELGWRGNLENIMYATAGPWANRMVAIDAVVSRRPPGGLMCAEVCTVGLLVRWPCWLSVYNARRSESRLAAGPLGVCCQLSNS